MQAKINGHSDVGRLRSINFLLNCLGTAQLLSTRSERPKTSSSIEVTFLQSSTENA